MLQPSAVDQVCSCSGSYGWTRIPDKGDDYWVCGSCLLPSRKFATEECDVCGHLYIKQTNPDKYLMCRECKEINDIKED